MHSLGSYLYCAWCMARDFRSSASRVAVKLWNVEAAACCIASISSLGMFLRLSTRPMRDIVPHTNPFRVQAAHILHII